VGDDGKGKHATFGKVGGFIVAWCYSSCRFISCSTYLGLTIGAFTMAYVCVSALAFLAP